MGWGGQEAIPLLQTVPPIPFPPHEAHTSPASPYPLGSFSLPVKVNNS